MLKTTIIYSEIFFTIVDFMRLEKKPKICSHCIFKKKFPQNRSYKCVEMTLKSVVYYCTLTVYCLPMSNQDLGEKNELFHCY